MKKLGAGAALALALLLISSAPAALGLQGAGVELTIHTVPPLEGITFRVYRPCTLYVPRSVLNPESCQPEPVPHLESWILTTDTAGVASLVIAEPGLYRVYVGGQTPADPSVQASFSRWQDDVFTNIRELRLLSSLQLTAGFDIARPVSLQIGAGGARLATERISAAEFRSSLGNVFLLEGAGPHWLPAEHVLNRDFGLESVPIVYALQRVEVDGGNVVNRGQQRFIAQPDGSSWQVEPLLFSAQFVARDALFGHRVGQGVLLEYPDGSTREFHYSGAGSVRIEDLARGTYRVSAAGAAGLAPPTVMVLSRDQTVSPVVITWLDIGVAAGGALIVAVALLLIGRPYLLPPLSRAGTSRSSGAEESA